MDIFFAPRFTKQYRKLTAQQQKATDVAIRKFQEDPFDPALRNHPLQGKLAGIRAVKAGYDLRLINQEQGGHVAILFLAAGTHDQVY